MRLAGWWGHKEDVRFEMKKGFIPEPGAAGWQLSNAPVFGMAVHRASLDLFDEVGMALLSEKSNALTQMMRKLLTEVLSIQNSHLFQIITPVNEAGAQLSLLTNNSGKKLFEHLEKNGVICDWREPNVIRMAAVPFYNSMTDVVRLAQAFLSFK
jgi:kynureninase